MYPHVSTVTGRAGPLLPAHARTDVPSRSGSHHPRNPREGEDVPKDASSGRCGPMTQQPEQDTLHAEQLTEEQRAQESDAARRRRRAQFLRELNEAKELRDRVQPRRARAARMRQQMRMRTFRW
ncbi:hypothetical protein GCM10018987_23750 [Streptomyces cremeus]